MDFDDEDLEIDTKVSNNNNNYDDPVHMQDNAMPSTRPGTAPRNPLGRQNSGNYLTNQS